jgi:hypothetical protein
VQIRGNFRNKPKVLSSAAHHIGKRAARGAGVGLIREAILAPLPGDAQLPATEPELGI